MRSSKSVTVLSSQGIVDDVEAGVVVFTYASGVLLAVGRGYEAALGGAAHLIDARPDLDHVHLVRGVHLAGQEDLVELRRRGLLGEHHVGSNDPVHSWPALGVVAHDSAFMGTSAPQSRQIGDQVMHGPSGGISSWRPSIS